MKVVAAIGISLLLSANAFANGDNDRPFVTGSYFAIIVDDVDVSAEWYKSVLRLEQKTRFSAPDRYDIVNLAGVGIHVELIEAISVAERPDGRVAGPFKVGILVADIAAFVAALPRDMERPEVINDERNGLLMLQLRDPDNYIVQVMQLLPE